LHNQLSINLHEFGDKMMDLTKKISKMTSFITSTTTFAFFFKKQKIV